MLLEVVLQLVTGMCKHRYSYHHHQAYGGHYHGKNPANLFFMIFIVNHGKNPTNLFFMIFIVYEFKYYASDWDHDCMVV